ncbi:hypothetical protein EV363DRAFT_1302524 [Boletus edulis]|nr:hypothetical protein EV363DRAFT_1302524 [Boletus edulis]
MSSLPVSPTVKVLVTQKDRDDRIVCLVGTTSDVFAFVEDAELLKKIEKHMKTIMPASPAFYRNRDGLQRHLRKHHGVKFSSAPSGDARPDQPFIPSHEEPASSDVVGGVSSGQRQEDGGFTAVRISHTSKQWATAVFSGMYCVHSLDGDAVRVAFTEDETVAVPMNHLGDNGEGDGCPSVALVPGRSYLESSPALSNLGLWLHTGLQVLMCCSCQVALSSKMAVGHLKKQHRVVVPEACKKELENICVQNRVYENPHEVPLPRAGGPPVEGIAPPTAGLTCAAGGNCRHGREEHEGGTLATTKYRASKVQVLFLGVGHVYFKGAGFDEVVAVDGSRDRPPLLNVTRWDGFMPEIRESVDQRHAARPLKGRHMVDEQEGIFDVLQRTVLGHHKTAREKLQHSANPFLPRKVLLNGPDFPAARSKSYFTMQSDDDNNHTRLFVQMVRAMIRTRQGHPCKLSFEYTEHQAVQLDALVECLKGAVQRPEAFQPTMVRHAYQAFCWSLIHNPGPEMLSRWADPIERFIWLLALGDDGTFVQASNLAPVLAKLKYFCQLTTLHEALVL